MTKRIDKTGERHGRLLVIEYDADGSTDKESRWWCQCDCGNRKSIGSGHLKRGGARETKSCGCLRAKKKDIKGHRFGKLLVTAFAGFSCLRGKRKKALWECQCDCGRVVIVLAGNLIRGNTQSCGCSHRKLPLRLSNFRSVYRKYMRAASNNGRVFELSEEDALSVFESDCFYCGKPPTNESWHTDPKHPFVYNGIDRFDNGKGYTKGNSIPCCRDCNVAKATRCCDDFLEWVIDIYHNMQLQYIDM